MKITLGEERVIVRGIRPEQQLWGPYQFPRPYDLGDRLVVAVHVDNDDIKSFGTDNRWFESRDRGATWQEIGLEVSVECGLKLQNGDKIYFPMESGISLKNYRMTEQKYRTPGYDYSKQAEEGTLPDTRRHDVLDGRHDYTRLPRRPAAAQSRRQQVAYEAPESGGEPAHDRVCSG